ncbi:PHB depolymerase family esterase [uncultured Sulfitobacter sp.]|uniref:extracellular catalytic domain type 1 short-chain-length polyhydroxyalkanoate depolymerase n=1 Tax=uncultured Sulfitobacter sp. TaxID=191468 RepID=UPI002604FDB9|nr:PHB depolymerase family esterase [uncultured Sulfitobacter sp.]
MKRFNAGAPHRATDDARVAHYSAASDLVRRTLAQHGLMPAAQEGDAGGLPFASPDITGLFGRLGTAHRRAPSVEAALPAGASFERQTYTCASGTRAYRTYVPSTGTQGIAGVVLMLHGCTQTPEDFAAGTGMNALAETHRLAVVYPHQARGENAQSCWNWFRRGDQMRGRGEPALLAGLVAQVASQHATPTTPVFVAGLSAGAAMAVILGETYPEVFSAVGAHSGLPFAAATDMPSAFAAMAGQAPRAAGSSVKGTVPTIVFHGSADTTVHPSNGDRIARDAHHPDVHQPLVTDNQSTVAGRRVDRTVTTTQQGRPVLEHWRIDGLGHAWSGGQPAGSYTDPAGPDASGEMIRFFFETTSESK